MPELERMNVFQQDLATGGPHRSGETPGQFVSTMVARTDCVVRGNDGVLRAFFNSAAITRCRRTQPCGQASLLHCLITAGTMGSMDP